MPVLPPPQVPVSSPAEPCASSFQEAKRALPAQSKGLTPEMEAQLLEASDKVAATDEACQVLQSQLVEIEGQMRALKKANAGLEDFTKELQDQNLDVVQQRDELQQALYAATENAVLLEDQVQSMKAAADGTQQALALARNSKAQDSALVSAWQNERDAAVKEMERVRKALLSLQDDLLNREEELEGLTKNLNTARGEKALTQAILLGWLDLFRKVRDQLGEALAKLDGTEAENGDLSDLAGNYEEALRDIAAKLDRPASRDAGSMQGEELSAAVKADVGHALADLDAAQQLCRVLEMYHVGLEDVHTALLATAEGVPANASPHLLENALDGDTQQLRQFIRDGLDAQQAAADEEPDPESERQVVCAAQYAQQVRQAVLDLAAERAGLDTELRPLSIYKDAVQQMHKDIIASLDNPPAEAADATTAAVPDSSTASPDDVADAVRKELEYAVKVADDLAQTLAEKEALRKAVSKLEPEAVALGLNLDNSEKAAARLDEEVADLKAEAEKAAAEAEAREAQLGVLEDEVKAMLEANEGLQQKVEDLEDSLAAAQNDLLGQGKAMDGFRDALHKVYDEAAASAGEPVDEDAKTDVLSSGLTRAASMAVPLVEQELARAEEARRKIKDLERDLAETEAALAEEEAERKQAQAKLGAAQDALHGVFEEAARSAGEDTSQDRELHAVAPGGLTNKANRALPLAKSELERLPALKKRLADVEGELEKTEKALEEEKDKLEAGLQALHDIYGEAAASAGESVDPQGRDLKSLAPNGLTMRATRALPLVQSELAKKAYDQKAMEELEKALEKAGEDAAAAKADHEEAEGKLDKAQEALHNIFGEAAASAGEAVDPEGRDLKAKSPEGLTLRASKALPLVKDELEKLSKAGKALDAAQDALHDIYEEAAKSADEPVDPQGRDLKATTPEGLTLRASKALPLVKAELEKLGKTVDAAQDALHDIYGEAAKSAGETVDPHGRDLKATTPEGLTLRASQALPKVKGELEKLGGTVDAAHGALHDIYEEAAKAAGETVDPQGRDLKATTPEGLTVRASKALPMVQDGLRKLAETDGALDAAQAALHDIYGEAAKSAGEPVDSQGRDLKATTPEGLTVRASKALPLVKGELEKLASTGGTLKAAQDALHDIYGEAAASAGETVDPQGRDLKATTPDGLTLRASNALPKVKDELDRLGGALGAAQDALHDVFAAAAESAGEPVDPQGRDLKATNPEGITVRAAQALPMVQGELEKLAKTGGALGAAQDALHDIFAEAAASAGEPVDAAGQDLKATTPEGITVRASKALPMVQGELEKLSSTGGALGAAQDALHDIFEEAAKSAGETVDPQGRDLKATTPEGITVRASKALPMVQGELEKLANTGSALKAAQDALHDLYSEAAKLAGEAVDPQGRDLKATTPEGLSLRASKAVPLVKGELEKLAKKVDAAQDALHDIYGEAAASAGETVDPQGRDLKATTPDGLTLRASKALPKVKDELDRLGGALGAAQDALHDVFAAAAESAGERVDPQGRDLKATTPEGITVRAAQALPMVQGELEKLAKTGGALGAAQDALHDIFEEAAASAGEVVDAAGQDLKATTPEGITVRASKALPLVKGELEKLSSTGGALGAAQDALHDIFEEAAKSAGETVDPQGRDLKATTPEGITLRASKALPKVKDELDRLGGALGAAQDALHDVFAAAADSAGEPVDPQGRDLKATTPEGITVRAAQALPMVQGELEKLAKTGGALGAAQDALHDIFAEAAASAGEAVDAAGSDLKATTPEGLTVRASKALPLVKGELEKLSNTGGALGAAQDALHDIFEEAAKSAGETVDPQGRDLKATTPEGITVRASKALPMVQGELEKLANTGSALKAAQDALHDLYSEAAKLAGEAVDPQGRDLKATTPEGLSLRASKAVPLVKGELEKLAKKVDAAQDALHDIYGEAAASAGETVDPQGRDLKATTPEGLTLRASKALPKVKDELDRLGGALGAAQDALHDVFAAAAESAGERVDPQGRDLKATTPEGITVRAAQALPMVQGELEKLAKTGGALGAAQDALHDIFEEAAASAGEVVDAAGQDLKATTPEGLTLRASKALPLVKGELEKLSNTGGALGAAQDALHDIFEEAAKSAGETVDPQGRDLKATTPEGLTVRASKALPMVQGELEKLSNTGGALGAAQDALHDIFEEAAKSAGETVDPQGRDLKATTPEGITVRASKALPMVQGELEKLANTGSALKAAQDALHDLYSEAAKLAGEAVDPQGRDLKATTPEGLSLRASKAVPLVKGELEKLAKKVDAAQDALHDIYGEAAASAGETVDPQGRDLKATTPDGLTVRASKALPKVKDELDRLGGALGAAQDALHDVFAAAAESAGERVDPQGRDLKATTPEGITVRAAQALPMVQGELEKLAKTGGALGAAQDALHDIYGEAAQAAGETIDPTGSDLKATTPEGLTVRASKALPLVKRELDKLSGTVEAAQDALHGIYEEAAKASGEVVDPQGRDLKATTPEGLTVRAASALPMVKDGFEKAANASNALQAAQDALHDIYDEAATSAGEKADPLGRDLKDTTPEGITVRASKALPLVKGELEKLSNAGAALGSAQDALHDIFEEAAKSAGETVDPQGRDLKATTPEGLTLRASKALPLVKGELQKLATTGTASDAAHDALHKIYEEAAKSAGESVDPQGRDLKATTPEGLTVRASKALPLVKGELEKLAKRAEAAQDALHDIFEEAAKSAGETVDPQGRDLKATTPEGITVRAAKALPMVKGEMEKLANAGDALGAAQDALHGIYGEAAKSAGQVIDPQGRDLKATTPEGISVRASKALPLTKGELEKYAALKDRAEELEVMLAKVHNDLNGKEAEGAKAAKELSAAQAALHDIFGEAAKSAGERVDPLDRDLKTISPDGLTARASKALPLVKGELEKLAALKQHCKEADSLASAAQEALASIAAEAAKSAGEKLDPQERDLRATDPETGLNKRAARALPMVKGELDRLASLQKEAEQAARELAGTKTALAAADGKVDAAQAALHDLFEDAAKSAGERIDPQGRDLKATTPEGLTVRAAKAVPLAKGELEKLAALKKHSKDAEGLFAAAQDALLDVFAEAAKSAGEKLDPQERDLRATDPSTGLCVRAARALPMVKGELDRLASLQKEAEQAARELEGTKTALAAADGKADAAQAALHDLFEDAAKSAGEKIDPQGRDLKATTPEGLTVRAAKAVPLAKGELEKLAALKKHSKDAEGLFAAAQDALLDVFAEAAKSAGEKLDPQERDLRVTDPSTGLCVRAARALPMVKGELDRLAALSKHADALQQHAQDVENELGATKKALAAEKAEHDEAKASKAKAEDIGAVAQGFLHDIFGEAAKTAGERVDPHQRDLKALSPEGITMRAARALPLVRGELNKYGELQEQAGDLQKKLDDLQKLLAREQADHDEAKAGKAKAEDTAGAAQDALHEIYAAAAETAGEKVDPQERDVHATTPEGLTSRAAKALPLAKAELRKYAALKDRAEDLERELAGLQKALGNEQAEKADAVKASTAAMDALHDIHGEAARSAGDRTDPQGRDLRVTTPEGLTGRASKALPMVQGELAKYAALMKDSGDQAAQLAELRKALAEEQAQHRESEEGRAKAEDIAAAAQAALHDIFAEGAKSSGERVDPQERDIYAKSPEGLSARANRALPLVKDELDKFAALKDKAGDLAAQLQKAAAALEEEQAGHQDTAAGKADAEAALEAAQAALHDIYAEAARAAGERLDPTGRDLQASSGPDGLTRRAVGALPMVRRELEKSGDRQQRIDDLERELDDLRKALSGNEADKAKVAAALDAAQAALHDIFAEAAKAAGERVDDRDLWVTTPEGLTARAAKALPLAKAELNKYGDLKDQADDLQRKLGDLQRLLAKEQADHSDTKADKSKADDIGAAAQAALHDIFEEAARAAGERVDPQGRDTRATTPEGLTVRASKALPAVKAELSKAAALKARLDDLERELDGLKKALRGEQGDKADLLRQADKLNGDNESLGKELDTAKRALAAYSDALHNVADEAGKAAGEPSFASSRSLHTLPTSSPSAGGLSPQAARALPLVQGELERAARDRKRLADLEAELEGARRAMDALAQESSQLQPYQQLARDVQAIALPHQNPPRSALPTGMRPDQECDAVRGLVEDGFKALHSRAAVDWMNLTAQLRDLEAKLAQLEKLLAEANKDTAAAREERDEVQADRNRLSKELSDLAWDADHRGKAADKALSDLKAQLAALDKELQEAAKKAADLQGARAADADKAAKAASELEARCRRLEAALEAKTAEAARAEGERDAAERRSDAVLKELQVTAADKCVCVPRGSLWPFVAGH